jgi:hypothetical protein
MILTEHVMEMGPMLVLAALMMGLLAETIWRAGGNGLGGRDAGARGAPTVS